MARSPWRSSFIFDEPDCRPVAQLHDFHRHPIEDGDMCECGDGPCQWRFTSPDQCRDMTTIRCAEPAPDSLPDLMFGDRAGDRVLLWLEGVFVGVCAVAFIVAVVLMNR